MKIIRIESKRELIKLPFEYYSSIEIIKYLRRFDLTGFTERKMIEEIIEFIENNSGVNYRETIEKRKKI